MSLQGSGPTAGDTVTEEEGEAVTEEFISGFDSCTKSLTASICIALLTEIDFPRQK